MPKKVDHYIYINMQKSEFKKVFSRKLKEARRRSNYTQSGFATALRDTGLRIAFSTYSNHEQGRSLPDTYTLFVINKLLGINVLDVDA